VNVFKAGIEEMAYATVPPRLDQVAIGELRRARYQLVSDLKTPGQYGIKHAFVLGVNEGQIPRSMTESSLLSEAERESLKKVGIELAPSLVQTQIDEQFILYTVFTSAKESLTLSYASSNDEGKEFLPSYIYSHLKNMFPNAIEAHISREWDEEVYEHLTTHTQTVSHLIATLKQYPNRRDYYEPLLNYYKETKPIVYQMMMQILNYQNDVTNLDEQLTKQLYSDEIVASVSRLELFNQCEFAHYLRYGLKLKEREQYKLDLPHIGELYHEALKRIAEKIKKENRSFADLTVAECQTLAQMVSDELSEQLLYKILRQSKRMMKLTERLTQVIYKTLLGLKYQGGHSAFKPLFFELPFDTKQTTGINLKSRELPNGFKLSLKGIIDRVDVAKNEEGTQAYLRIIDYKSSNKDLELDKVYYGLSLQLLTYLDIVVTNALQLVDLPADIGGLLYFHVHHPFISHDVDDLLHQESYQEKVEQMQQEKYKMNGYLPENYEVIHLSDQRLNEQVKSDIVPITLKKDGSFAARGNSTLTGDSLQMLREYTNRMIEDSATKITQGQLNINPTTYGKSTACDYCQYRGICQFDADFLGNQSRILPKMKPDLVMEAMKCKLEEGGTNDESI
ncbi:MAG: PD-(D/E)XK nuclease family protein, partial [Turicibacter sp.]|nr:PD-(D/E)XK nuclease family protein [Turicibacter sp.]